MRNNDKTLLPSLLMLPFVALAHGQEIFYTLLSQIIVLILVLITIRFLNWKLKGKLILIALYFLLIFATELCISRLPYFENEVLITLLLLFIPAIFTYLIYSKLKISFEKGNKKKYRRHSK
jgi:4-amino-4-deoxy-L-arabinose transferase-like glycosyltransferase